VWNHLGLCLFHQHELQLNKVSYCSSSHLLIVNITLSIKKPPKPPQKEKEKKPKGASSLFRKLPFMKISHEVHETHIPSFVKET
jgi:hypothetical protein